MTLSTKLTLDEFLAQPETEPASEYARGEVVPKPMPTGIHAILQGLVSMLLWQAVEPAGLGEVGTEWRCVFGPPGGERSFVPDVCFVTRARLPATRAGFLGPFRGPPDLAVEILSPDQAASRLVEKVQFYIRHGVRLVWLIDPSEESITVLAPDRDAVRLSKADRLDGGDVVPGFAVPVAEVFRRLPPVEEVSA
jgi:Uma2 family endonuclease